MKLWVTLCVLVGIALPVEAAVTREPYLQLVTPTSITLVWQTDLNSANNSRVQYGTTAGNLNQTELGAAVISPSNAGVKNHVVTITGLSATTTYFYNVGTVTDGVQAGGTTEHFFRTAPTAGTSTPFTAWVVGDSGFATADQVAVRDAMVAVTGSSPPNLFLHAGDIAYPNGTDPEFTSNHFTIYQNILRQTPFWPTLGNHEAPSVNTALGLGPYYEAHVLPTGGEAGGIPSGTEAYYSFDYANVHFIVLDSMDSSRAPGSPMLMWLQNDLAGTAQEWVIALFHHPPYSKGSHDSDSNADSGGRLVDMRETVLPILEAGGVDLVLAGHSHLYERSYPLSGAYGYGSFPDFVTPDFNTLLMNGNILDTGSGSPTSGGAYQSGTIYVVAGHGGRSIGTGSADHPVMFFSEKEFGSVLLDINGSSLTLRNVRSNGSITDTFIISKINLANMNVVWRNTSTGDVAGWQVNALGLENSGGIGAVSTDWEIVGVGDLDGNGTADLAWRNTNTGEVAVWLMNGLVLDSSAVIATVSTDWEIVGVGDLDGNGTADLAWRNMNTGEVAGWLMNGLVLTNFAILVSVSTDWKIVGMGDLDGNDTADLAWRNTNTGEVAGWLMNGLDLDNSGVIATVSTDWEIVGVGDLDGDAHDDIVWRNTNTGDVSGWLMNGLDLDSSGVIATVSTDWKIRGVSEFDGNTKADLAWRNTSTGDVACWLMNGLGLAGSGVIVNGVLPAWEIQ